LQRAKETAEELAAVRAELEKLRKEPAASPVSHRSPIASTIAKSF